MSGRHDGCYLRATEACCTKISGEHLISETVLDVLAEKQVEVSGLPWLKGETKKLGFAALTSKCLCRTHNSALDGQLKRLPRGNYMVSAFKQLVGVTSDRELDVVDHDVFKPLDDNAEITIHECEVFVSHVRTGGSSY